MRGSGGSTFTFVRSAVLLSDDVPVEKTANNQVIENHVGAERGSLLCLESSQNTSVGRSDQFRGIYMSALAPKPTMFSNKKTRWHARKLPSIVKCAEPFVPRSPPCI